ncbi:MAG: Gfo/Idh/MocA family protein [Pseudobdellovibrio sp.]
MKKILIAGYGSIGQRHFKNFFDMGCDVALVSRRKLDVEANLYSSVSEAVTSYSPDIVFICNETYLHAEVLQQLDERQYSGLIIIEKPIFDLNFTQYEKFKHLNIKVSYNLRFTSFLQYLKKELSHQKIISSQAYVGQYLPTWRKNTDYRTSYSADASKGGGVLLDLSHELDFCCWLFGKAKGLFSLNGQWSDLEINSIDTCALIIKHENCPVVDLQLNYTDRRVQRYLTVTTTEATYKIDFIAKKAYKNEHEISLDQDAADSYLQMSYDIIHNSGASLTSYDEAVHIMKMMSAAMLSSQKLQWVNI